MSEPPLDLGPTAVGASALDETLVSVAQPKSERPEANQPGRAIGRYVMLYRLGAGGMGVVFAAYDPQLDRKVAIKLLATQSGDVKHAHDRLRREAQALAKLDHRNVVSVHDVGVHEGQLFIAMDFVAGRTLG